MTAYCSDTQFVAHYIVQHVPLEIVQSVSILMYKGQVQNIDILFVFKYV